MEDNLVYSKYTELKVILSKKYLRATYRLVFDQISEYYGLPKFTYKINHHNSRKVKFKVRLELILLSLLAPWPIP